MANLSRRDIIRVAYGLIASQQIESLFPALNATIGASHSTKGFPTSPAIDTHIHFYDLRLPGEIPWPEDESLNDADNDWLLRTAKTDTLIVGTIGDLEPALSEFPQQLDRFREEPVFFGIRYGNLWGRDLESRLKEGFFVDNLKLLARYQLLLESANPDPALIANLLQLTALVPDLRIILDHLRQAVPSKEPLAREAYLRDL